MWVYLEPGTGATTFCDLFQNVYYLLITRLLFLKIKNGYSLFLIESQWMLTYIVQMGKLRHRDVLDHMAHMGRSQRALLFAVMFFCIC